MNNANDTEESMWDRMRLQAWRSILLGILLVGIMVVSNGVVSQAETIDFKAKMLSLKAKFPHETYWNHVGSTVDDPDKYTLSPCSLHGTDGIHVAGSGGCTCNHFVNANHGGKSTQCMGFAYKLGYDVFGDVTWKTNPTQTPITDIKVGDIIRISGYHSVFVVARTDNKVLVVEANYPKNCQIYWNREIDLSTVTISYYERAANYDAIIGSQTLDIATWNAAVSSGVATEDASGESTTEQDSAEATSEDITTEAVTEEAITDEVATDFTGWKQTPDGEHYRYYKSGKLQKNKWLTIKKKKYYVDSKGYRITGFYDIKEHTYYFDEEGVLKTKQWFSISKNTYYANEDGIILKSQWLYHKSTLVYVVADGSIAKSEIVKIGSKQYYFNSKGKRSKGFKKCKGKYYYCNSKGVIQKKKWVTKSGKKYYLQKSGVRAQSKLLKIGKYRYYFNAKGQMVKNKKVTYKDKIYKADKKGRCKYVADVETTEESPQDYTNSTEYTNEATTQAVSTIE